MASRLARFSWLPGGLAATAVIVIGRLVAPDSSASLETAVYDRVQRSSDIEASADLVIIGIDSASLGSLGGWPWSNDIHARLIETLTTHGARTIAFTEPFRASPQSQDEERVRAALKLLESSNLGQSEQARQLRILLDSAKRGVDPDTHLQQAITAHGNVVLPIELRLGDGVDAALSLPSRAIVTGNESALDAAANAVGVRLPQDEFAAGAAAFGHTFLHADDDGVVRRDLAAVRSAQVLLPSLAVAVAARAASPAPVPPVFADAASLRIAARSVPLSGQLQLLPQYLPAQKFTVHSYWQVLNGAIGAAQVRDKIVLIGMTDAQSTDATMIATPVGRATPDVIAIASAIAALHGTPAYSHPGYAQLIEWLAMLAVILCAALLLPAVGAGGGAIVTTLAVAILGVSEIGVLSSLGVWLQFMTACIALLAGFALYLVGEFIRRANVRAGSSGRDSPASLRALGQTFQKQGQLDLAFETYQRCPLDAPTMELLYYLGTDFERRRQLQKAGEVYNYIATRDPNYRDLRTRRARTSPAPAPAAREPVAAPPAAPPPAPRTARPTEQRRETPAASTGRTLGRYEIERELGKGAMGVVYLGRDPKINRVVAIKAIPLAEEFAGDDLEEARARFFREAEMAGRLNHPAIVTVYDAGEDQGLAYIAMEYLRGQHLSHHTDAARLLPVGTVISLVARVADALHYAHRQNVVHRDIKPANIMFNADTDELKITDFGIARLTDTSRTKTGIVLGTPSFMSPEQLEGRSLDGRSDQFALGISLYQLLCGQLPFRAESMPRLMQKIATEAHLPMRSLRPDLPECLDTIMDRVLSKAEDDRYATCAEFAAALRECGKGLEPARPARSEHEWLIP